MLWVDDDASIRHFVALALEDEPLDLQLCASVAQARTVLAQAIPGRAQAPVTLLVTDLMMPGDTGFDLLEGLARQPVAQPLPRTVVFSARLDAASQQRMAELQVWRHLLKPASVAELLACVRDGVQASAGHAPSAAPAPDAEQKRRQRAIAHAFGGDAVLFDRFEAACRVQFAVDRDVGDAAAARGDLASLRLQGHSLKSVLRMLGHEGPAQQAQLLEGAADLAAASQAWAQLRHLLPL